MLSTLDRRNSVSRGRFLRNLIVCSLGLALLVTICVAAVASDERFIWGRESEYDNLDPHLVFDNSRVATRLNFYDSLYRWEDNPPLIVPWLADSYEVSDDGLAWRFTLREGVKFHDGSELTAEAVRYSMERQLALGQGAAALFAMVVEPGTTRVIDDYTVEFNLSKTFSPFLSIVPVLYIVNPAILKAHEVDEDWGSMWLANNEAGSGSYQLLDYDPAVGVTMERFEDHFLGWEGKHVDIVEFRTIHEIASRTLALMKGEIHATDSDLRGEQLARLEKDPNVTVTREPSMRTFVITVNNQKPPLNDVHVRRAISYAFDYDGFIDEVLDGRVTRNPGPTPFNLWAASPDLKGYEYNLDKAREELAKAEVPIDRPIEFHAMVGLPETVECGLILQNGLAQIGIELKITEDTWPTLTQLAKTPETAPDMWPHWISTYYPDPNNWIGEMYNSANWGTWKASCWYENARVDELLNRALEVSNLEERRELYEEATEIIVEDAVDLWIYNTDAFYVFRNNVHGARFCPVGNGQEVRWIYMEE